jgi:hypothetical protein
MTQDHKLTVRFKRLKELLFFSESCQCPGARGTGGTSKEQVDVGGADVRSLRGTYSLSAARSYTMRSYTMLVQMSCVMYHGYTLACAFARQPE